MYFKKFKILAFFLLLGFPLKVFADFGQADFPSGTFADGPKSYHDGLCRDLKNKCRIRFQGPFMWVEGEGGISIDQFLKYRLDVDGRWSSAKEFYNYITYKSNENYEREALFLFHNEKAQRDFIDALNRWRKQESRPIPNYRMPNSQGPQNTQGRDEGLNPYENEPIIDFMKKTTNEKKGKKGNINCDSPVWKNKPRCN